VRQIYDFGIRYNEAPSFQAKLITTNGARGFFAHCGFLTDAPLAQLI
jgi:hypothetical protein